MAGFLILVIALAVILSFKRPAIGQVESSRAIPTPSSLIAVQSQDTIKLVSPLTLWARYQ